MFNIFSGKCKSGKSSIALKLARGYANVLYYTDDQVDELREAFESNYVTFKSTFTVDTLEKDIKNATHVINSPSSGWHGMTIEVKLVMIDCGCLLSSEDKERIAAIAVSTQTKIIFCETIKNYD